MTIEKDYPVLIGFKHNLRLVLDVKFIDGYYFERYEVLRKEGDYMHQLFVSIFRAEAERFFELQPY